jgi:hypothetical protein
MKPFYPVTILMFVVLSYMAARSGTPEFYVSRNGNNSDGLSWATAWNELDQIDWEQIQAGAIINIDGGSAEMTYETELHIGSSGSAEAPIRIQVSNEEGHSGQVVFFGGRQDDLPYCGQSDYTDLPEEQMREYAIRTNDYDYIEIDGRRWRGIVIRGYGSSGLRIDPDSYSITVQNLEIYNNGEAIEDDDGWRSNSAGVRLGGENVTLRRMLIHDNGQDAIQSLNGDNQIHNFRLEQSWLYNERRHPSSGQSFNYCTHTDGIQIYDGGVVSGIEIHESIIGPGFTQNILFGQTLNDNGSWADVQDVVFQDVVFSKAADNNVISYRDSHPSNWYLDHVTLDCLGTESHCLKIYNSNHTVQNSIVVNGLITFPDGLDNQSGNCQWNTHGYEIGQETDPLFENVSSESVFSLDNYLVSPQSPCQGSRIGSAEQLLAMEDNSNGD